MRNITQDITDRMEILRKKLDELRRKRSAIDMELTQIEEWLQALRTTLNWEEAFHGSPSPTNAPASTPTAWLGVSLGKAIETLLKEHPTWGFRQIRDRLVHDGFDFKGKKPGNAVNMALIKLRLKQNGADDAEG